MAVLDDDNDGIPDTEDPDDDNDGIPDIGTVPEGGTKPKNFNLFLKVIFCGKLCLYIDSTYKQNEHS